MRQCEVPLTGGWALASRSRTRSHCACPNGGCVWACEHPRAKAGRRMRRNRPGVDNPTLPNADVTTCWWICSVLGLRAQSLHSLVQRAPPRPLQSTSTPCAGIWDYNQHDGSALFCSTQGARRRAGGCAATSGWCVCGERVAERQPQTAKTKKERVAGQPES